tara:strand:- start:119 stop:283 length:165 start_codon:yes stop_codon:yes gene_type:complete
MIREKYTINDILEAVNEIKNFKKKEKIKIKNKEENKDIPINTLKLIEEAEKGIK